MLFVHLDERRVEEATRTMRKGVHKRQDTSKQHHAFYEQDVEKVIMSVDETTPKEKSLALGLLVLWEIAGRCQDLTKLTVNVFKQAVDQENGYWKIPIVAQKTQARCALISDKTM